MNRGPVVREGYVYIAAALFLAVVMYFGFGVLHFLSEIN